VKYQLERVSFIFLWEDRLEPYETIILNSNLRKLKFNYEINIRIKKASFVIDLRKKQYRGEIRDVNNERCFFLLIFVRRILHAYTMCVKKKKLIVLFAFSTALIN